jgi:hypothetical protein
LILFQVKCTFKKHIKKKEPITLQNTDVQVDMANERKKGKKTKEIKNESLRACLGLW